MNHRKKGSALAWLAIASAVSLTGCANYPRTAASAEAGMRKAKALFPETKAPTAPVDTGRFVVSKGTWLGSSVIVNSHGDPLPSRFETASGVELGNAVPLGLAQIAQLITSKTGIPVSLSADVRSGGGGSSGRATAPATGGPVSSQINSVVSQANGGSNIGAGGDIVQPQAALAAMYSNYGESMPIHFQGSLSNFLNEVGDNFGVSWKYNGAEIRFFRDITKSWTIASLDSAITLKSKVNSSNALQASTGGSGSGTSGGSLSGTYSTESTTALSVNVWNDLENGLKGILGNNGDLTTSPSTGMVTVTAPPQLIEAAQRFIEAENHRLSKMVAVSVEVLSVSASTSDNNNFSLNSVFQALGHVGNYSLNLGNATTAAGSVAGALSATTPGLAFGVLSPTSAVSGTNVLATALSTLGRVKTLYNTGVTTMNGIPTPLQVSHTQSYLASVTTTNLGGTSGGVQTQLTPGVVTTGVSFNVLPRVDPGQAGVMLQFSMTISALVGTNGGFNTVTDAGNTLQLPDIRSQEFTEQADVPSGSTVVLAGYNQVNDTVGRTGTGSPYNFLLGGGATDSHAHQIVILLMTPVEISNPEMLKESGS